MAQKLFIASEVTERLLKILVDRTGMKMGQIVNESIQSSFLPLTQPLKVEAAALLMYGNEADDFFVRQSISRGISWLEKFPISTDHWIREIMSHYHDRKNSKYNLSVQNEYVRGKFLTFGRDVLGISWNEKTTMTTILYDIVRKWYLIWEHKEVYDLISTIVFTVPFDGRVDWFTGIQMLNMFEGYAFEYHFDRKMIDASTVGGANKL